MSGSETIFIRLATEQDKDALWQILKPVLRAGETYALPQDWGKNDALAFWLAPEKQTYVAIIEGKVCGTYYLKPNQLGGGSHVANCGYVTAQGFEGRGIASSLCKHSLNEAKKQGFAAMQFNCVVSSNLGAISLWQKHGFDILASLPKAFNHPSLGMIDAYVMYQTF